MKRFVLAFLMAACGPAAAQEIREGSFPQTTGEGIYGAICQGCHMADARGAGGAGRYPALAGNPRLAEAGYPVAVVLHGQKAMPWFGDQLSDAQVAAVVNYVRGHFGNRFPGTVTPQQVRSMR